MVGVISWLVYIYVYVFCYDVEKGRVKILFIFYFIFYLIFCFFIDNVINLDLNLFFCDVVVVFKNVCLFKCFVMVIKCMIWSMIWRIIKYFFVSKLSIG